MWYRTITTHIYVPLDPIKLSVASAIIDASAFTNRRMSISMIMIKISMIRRWYKNRSAITSGQVSSTDQCYCYGLCFSLGFNLGFRLGIGLRLTP